MQALQAAQRLDASGAPQTRGGQVEKALSLVDVEAGYGHESVLKGLSLDVAVGEFVVIIGPNGCGKTTAVKAATGLLPPRRGSVRLFGTDVRALGPRRIAEMVGVVPQQFESAYDFTVRELVQMGRYAARRRDAAAGWARAGRFRVDGVRAGKFPAGVAQPDPVKRALSATGLEELADRSFATLSGGEKQRAILAQALAGEPRLLLLDEPTAHLDIGYQLELFDLLRSLHAAEGLTVVAVLHDLNLASQYAETMVLMSGGSVFSAGRPSEVLTADNLRAAYGVDARVFADPLSGRPYVSILSRKHHDSIPEQDASSAKARSKKIRRVHVVGGGGAAGYLLQEFYHQGYDISAGVLNRMDTDWELAVRLGCRVIEAPPFSPVTEQATKENCDAMVAADVVVVANIPVGNGNLANLEAALQAARAGKTVIIVSLTPVDERDFTGGKGTALWGELVHSGAREATSLTEFWRLFGELLGEKWA